MMVDTPSQLVPKRRFAEFRDTPGWSKRPLREFLTPIVREREKPAVPYTGLGIRSHGRGTFRKELVRPEKTSMDRLYEVDCDDLIVNITFAWEGAIAIVRSEDTGALVSHRFPTYQFDQNAVLPDFFRYPILDKQFVYNLGVISPGGAGRNRVLNKADFLKIGLALPEVAEQQKIADCLGSLDDLIAAEDRKLEALRQHKQGLMQQLFPQPGETVPRLRFPEFTQGPGWDHATVADLVETVTPPKKLTTSTYLEDGRFPIINQSQSYICGWTNDDDAVITSPLPVIVFGDHTCVLKFVNRPFAQGADGVKILTARRRVSTLYLYHQLTHRPVVTEEYKRHFSALKDKVVCFPDPKSGEQQRIAGCLFSLDAGLAAQVQKLNALKTHKQGLLQQIFPSLESH